MTEEKRGPGRPRKYAPDVAKDGAPQLLLRLDPDLKAWVMAHGGQAYVRQVLTEAREREAAPVGPAETR